MKFSASAKKKERSIEDLMISEEDLGIDENNMLETHTLQKISLESLNWNSQFFDYSEEPYLFYLAELLAKEGIELEIIDLRTVRPMDHETILTSVKKTNRLVVLEEAWPFASVASEITYMVQERAFDYLDAPIQRITTADTPAPYSPTLLKEWLPNAEDVIKAVKKVLYK